MPIGRPLQEPEDRRSRTCKARLGEKTLAVIDEARGRNTRGVWIRAAVLHSLDGSVPEWPAELADDERHEREIGFRLLPAELEAIDAARRGLPRGVWIRSAAVRVSHAVRAGALNPKDLTLPK